MRDDQGGRCCLGHMCDALGVPHMKIDGRHCYGNINIDVIKSGRLSSSFPDVYEEVDFSFSIAPKSLIKDVGLYYPNGETKNSEPLALSNVKSDVYDDYESLADANDSADYTTPLFMAKYLESVIEGGPGTPWRPLTSYRKESWA